MSESSPRIEIVPTAWLDPETRASARRLCDGAFRNYNDETWEHALGGIHVLVWHQEELVAHGAVVLRRLIHGGRTLRTGYVESVAVRAENRRQGLGGRVMESAEAVIRGGYELGALSASEAGAPLYAARGWHRWQGRTWGLTPDGTVRTEEEDDSVFVLPVGDPLDRSGELTCDWRPGYLW